MSGDSPVINFEHSGFTMDTSSHPAGRHQPQFRLYLAFSLLCLAAFAVATLLYLRTEAGVKKRIYAELSAIADLKLDQIVKWRSDRLSFAENIENDPFLNEAALRWIGNPGDKNLENRLRGWMANAGSLYQFSNVALIDSQCTILLSVKDSSSLADPTIRAAVGSASSSGEPQFSDLHRGAKGDIQIDLVAPLGLPAVAGLVLVFEVNPDKFLFPLIRSWPMPSATSETLILRLSGDSIEYLSELRHRKNSALSFKLPLSKKGLLAVDAVRRGTGVYDRIDYRDQPVLGAVRSIPNSPWYMVAKVDKAEIMAPVKQQFLIFLAFVFLAAMCAIVTFLLIYRHQRVRYYHSLYKAEQDKSRSEARFRALFNSMTEGVALHEIVHDDHGKPVDYRIVDVNPAFTNCTGISAENAKGRLATDLYNSPTPPYFDDSLQVAQTGKPVTFETFYPPMGKYFSMAVFSPGIDLFATVFEDITDRRKTEEALRNAQKIESLGVLAGGIVHDFNNLLGGIFGYISMAIDEGGDRRTVGHLAKAIDTMERARALTRQLLTFAKGGAPARRRGDLFPFIQETAQFALSGAKVSCFCDVESGLRQCDFDKNQIAQVVDNVVINAQQAMPQGGAITITAKNVTLAASQVGTLKKGPYVQVSVHDNGIGIAADILPRIFDPFFTTKQKGSGLGLATAISIMTKHDGYIDVESTPGKGAAVHLYLPAATENEGSAAPAGAEVIRHKGEGRILVMDDEEVMRDAIGSMLESLGYNVIPHCNGDEVIRRFLDDKKQGHPVAAVILDLTIPGGMGGKETGEELRKHDATVPIFISSGYAEDPILADPQKYGFTDSICKPYLKAELASMLERHLGKKG
jgi:PAS domain S-box-containing protein